MSMTLEESIRFHTEEAERMKLMKLDKRINKLILGSDAYEGLLQEHAQTAEWLKELSRARTLLKATHELLEIAKKSPYVLETLRIVVHYDEADCDGNCLKEDIENYFDEYGEDGDAE